MKPFHQWTREDRERYYAALLTHINDPEYFASHIGVKVTRVADGEADGELFADEVNCNSMGIVHGGALYTLADTVGGMAAFSRGYSCTTASATLNYLRPGVKGRRVFCHARAQKMGRTLSVIRVDITGERGLPLATGLFTFCAMAPVNWDGESGEMVTTTG